VGRIDLANNFAMTPLQSHPSEIRRSDIGKGVPFARLSLFCPTIFSTELPCEASSLPLL
jgi:hypothetical protein